MIPLALVVGEGPRFGTGHTVRMRELRAMLNQTGRAATIETSRWQSVRGFEADDAHAAARSLLTSQSQSASPLVILDARDLDPRPFVEQGARVLALDNRHACREASLKSPAGAIDFYDTLPHPDANLQETLERMLLAADVRAIAESQRGFTGADASQAVPPAGNRSRSLFVYSGDFEVPPLDDALLRLSEDGWSVHRCGSVPPPDNSLRYSPRLERSEFLRELAAADRVWTYFGMTLFEAWYLQRDLALLPVESPVHASLADYLYQAVGLAVVAPASVSTNGAEAFAGAPSRVADLRPGGRGFELLIERIRALSPP